MVKHAVVIPSGKNVTLDLNGKKLSLKNGAVGSVIRVEGTLTLNDSVSWAAHDYTDIHGGIITGGNADNGGGICIETGGMLNMNGGTVTGNTASGKGGGVYINGNGAFLMSSGAIAHNKAENGGACIWSRTPSSQ